MMIPADARKIAILVSGGIDSSLLLYLLCKEIHVTQRPINIEAYSMKVHNPIQVTLTQKIIDYVTSKFPISVPYNHTMRKTLIRNGVKSILEVTQADYVFTGCNKVIEGEFTPTRIIQDDTPPVRGNPFNHKHLRPFINLDKREIIEIYFKENILDMLPFTLSCGILENSKTNELQECKECYFCMEKQWALNFYGL